ncbi:MAG TPA: OmpA family protein [Vicinamibacteria bacterium]|jgi:outer membrane protein OmpA-like peptidoglycan-associated protein
MRKTIAVLTAAAFTATGCASMNKTQQGAVIGAGAGTVIGGAIGHATGSTARGAILGAVVGGAAGALIGRHMDKQAERLAQELEGAKVSRVGEGIAVTFEDGILFPFDSAELMPAARGNLRKLADSLQSEPRTEVMIIGHTDSRGTDAYNQDLSLRRARSASSYVGAQGVSRDRLLPSGKGEQEPVASNATDDGRQQNRRVEIAIYANEEWRNEARREARAR